MRQPAQVPPTIAVAGARAHRRQELDPAGRQASPALRVLPASAEPVADGRGRGILVVGMHGHVPMQVHRGLPSLLVRPVPRGPEVAGAPSPGRLGRPGYRTRQEGPRAPARLADRWTYATISTDSRIAGMMRSGWSWA